MAIRAECYGDNSNNNIITAIIVIIITTTKTLITNLPKTDISLWRLENELLENVSRFCPQVGLGGKDGLEVQYFVLLQNMYLKSGFL